MQQRSLTRELASETIASLSERYMITVKAMDGDGTKKAGREKLPSRYIIGSLALRMKAELAAEKDARRGHKHL